MILSTEKKIGIILLISGILGVTFSIYFQSLILTYMTLTLILWGCFFLLILNENFVTTEIMFHSNISILSALDKIILNNKFNGKAIYIPVPKEMYLPYHIGFEDEFIYFPKKNVQNDVALEQAYNSRNNINGLRIIPPGLSLANLIEKKSGLSFQKLNLNSLREVLLPIITHELKIAKDIKINNKENEINIQIHEPILKKFHTEYEHLKNICTNIGCPICSSMACILIRITKKPIIIKHCSVNKNILEIIFQIM